MRNGQIFATLLFSLLLTGCPFPVGPTAHRPHGGEDPSRLALLDIGERALEDGERQTREGQIQAALASYRKALWAFEYHQRLTGESPLFLEEVQDSIRRLEAASKASAEPIRN